MEEIYKYMLEFGFKKEQIDKIVYKYSIKNMLPTTLLNNIQKNNQWFLENGYNKNNIIKMTISSPAICELSIENIKQKIEDLITLGYTKEQIIKMTILLSSIFGLSIENIKQKIEDLITLGYTKEQIIKMTISLPAIYSYSIEKIKQKIAFYREIELDFVTTEKTKYLMQSVELSYARYNYFKDKGIIINRQNYTYLFYNEKQFSKQFGVSKKELLLMYPYKAEEKKENVR